MSRSRRALFFIGILIIVSLALIGSYFALIALGELKKPKVEEALPDTNITYSFDIQTKEYNESVYGVSKVDRSGSLIKGHYEEITHSFDEGTNTYIPTVKIKDSKGQDVSSEYEIVISKKYTQVDFINLYIQQEEYVEYAGIIADAYKNTTSLKQGYYLLGDCKLETEMDVATFESKPKKAQFNIKIVSSNNEELNFFNLDITSRVLILKDRMIKIKAFYEEYIDLPYYELVEGSLVYGHELKLKYYGYEDYCVIKIYDENDIDVSRYYDVIVVEFN